MIKEKEITKLIINEYFNSLLSDIEIDVAIVGAGPSGLTAARILAKHGKKVAIFESRVAPGGGMWGGRHALSRYCCEAGEGIAGRSGREVQAC